MTSWKIWRRHVIKVFENGDNLAKILMVTKMKEKKPLSVTVPQLLIPKPRTDILDLVFHSVIAM